VPDGIRIESAKDDRVQSKTGQRERDHPFSVAQCGRCLSTRPLILAGMWLARTDGWIQFSCFLLLSPFQAQLFTVEIS